ncbi:hypothetical protein M2459_002631 [Parabacteroides sp. PF5-5]|uniref:hypothetical protein n=1 Tax=unclassified Parabacteroides TaxID=2649774 RepID=UPI002476DE24|nr:MULTISPECIES: hypothetical protein [unclassified Parabacteroides]MDH6306268.1 hypothetical protein [Parabacteroides sp. PH5-39]MDH6316941.1 hypothetical protein [Parabacteroides sp. PF5-13]MDH6321010.1 hypothetical protein [Parabacteroides sp. PH5-13]MDH6324742.1 hypothetical protein [Parabacteroides sp. PH5-8]MDH6328126.1 hypothetical protein [Parabacteroides sp. PH5-41]
MNIFLIDAISIVELLGAIAFIQYDKGKTLKELLYDTIKTFSKWYIGLLLLLLPLILGFNIDSYQVYLKTQALRYITWDSFLLFPIRVPCMFNYIFGAGLIYCIAVLPINIAISFFVRKWHRKINGFNWNWKRIRLGYCYYIATLMLLLILRVGYFLENGDNIYVIVSIIILYLMFRKQYINGLILLFLYPIPLIAYRLGTHLHPMVDKFIHHLIYMI